VKLFIPELLATKIAQHGTLDAVFGGRSAGVICHTLNLDSPIAKAGLQLGDRLVAFEGVPIHEANDFTNLLSMYPAGWPAEVTFEHEGVQQTARVRLTALPYEPLVKPQYKPEEDKPEEERDEKKEAEDEKPAEGALQPGSEDPPMPDGLKVEQPKFDLGNAGKVRDANLNATVADQILNRWRESLSGKIDSGAVVIESNIWRREEIVGQQTLTIAANGRLRAEYSVDGKTTVTALDGKSHWQMQAGRVAQEVTLAKAIRDPHFAQAAVLSVWLAGEPLSRFGQVHLDAADKAAGRLCYRLSATDASSEQLFVWLSVDYDPRTPRIDLVKSGVGIDDSEPIPSTIYGQLESFEGLTIPAKRTLVRGLSEAVGLEIVTSECKAESKVSEGLFARPE
jgi:serine protease Do